MASIFTRSTTTFGGVLHLARVGYGDQAAMLNRSLFEDLVDAGWCVLNADTAAAWLQDHHTHRRMLLADAASSESAYGSSIGVPKFDQVERQRLDRKFGKYGQKPWNGKNINQKAQEIEPLFKAPDDLETLRFFRTIVHKENNGLLHMGASAVDTITLGLDGEGLQMRIGPSNAHIDEALLGGYWSFLQTTRLVVDHFAFPSAVRRRFLRLHDRLADMRPTAIGGSGRASLEYA